MNEGTVYQHIKRAEELFIDLSRTAARASEEVHEKAAVVFARFFGAVDQVNEVLEGGEPKGGAAIVGRVDLLRGAQVNLQRCIDSLDSLIDRKLAVAAADVVRLDTLQDTIRDFQDSVGQAEKPATKAES